MQTNQQVQIKRLRWNADKTPMEGTVIASSIMGCTIRIAGRDVQFNRIGISTCLRYQIISPVNFTHG